jgi:hypothetical protein
MPNLPGGTILKSRSVTYAPVGGVPMSNSAWQLQFGSHDVNGNPIAAVATVVKPLFAASSPHLLSFQFAEDSLGSICAPSHTVTGSTSNAISQSESPEALSLLDSGYTLVYPDYEGPYSEYAAGTVEGQITLDGIRAALHFTQLGLSATTPVGMWGYSGGAIATAWASTLESSYAPELNIVAIAHGGTPAVLEGVANNIDTDTVANEAFFSLVLTAILGINRAYPTFATPMLNAKGVAAAQSLANSCGTLSPLSSTPSGTIPDYTTVSNPFSAPNVLAVLPLIDLPQAKKSPSAPSIFVYHSQLDELIPIADGGDAIVPPWCAAGSHITYYRGVTGDHAAFEVTMAPIVVAYFEAIANGIAPVFPLGSTTCN